MFSIIVAMGRRRAIGMEGRIPWRLPDDMRMFRRLTLGKPLLMGRKTFESLPGLLPGRPHYVLTSHPGYCPPPDRRDCVVLHGWLEAERALEEAGYGRDQEIMVIGGAGIYEQALARASRLYLTLIHEDFEADAFFPALPQAGLQSGLWHVAEHEFHPIQEPGSPFPWSFLLLERQNDVQGNS